MKKLVFLFFASFVVLTLSCDEIPPDISAPSGGGNSGTGSTDLTEQKRQVLIEEFTGVECVNCPAGSAQIESMLATFGEQLVAVSIHAGFFADPLANSLYDFQTTDGDAILDYLGQPVGFPTAVINRKQFDGEDDLQVFQSTWNGLISVEMMIEPQIKIGIETDFDANSREATVDLTFLPTTVLSNENLRFTVMLTESNIMDYQIVPDQSDPVSDYTHKHVFRDVLTTNFDGDPITEEIIPNVSFEKSLTYILPTDWDENECSIIAFVNYSGGNKEVLQAAEVHLIE